MALDNRTLARPYAKAIFDLALGEGHMSAWSTMLEAAALVAQDSQMQALLVDPRVTHEQLVDLFFSACGTVLNQQGHNLIKLLANNKRLAVLPEIKVLFSALRADYEKTLQVDVVSFAPLSEQQQQQLVEKCRQRWQRQIVLNNTVNEAILGGAVIRAGDFVIDGSVRGKLAQLDAALATE